ncbi:hypothetical protein R2F61_09795 (plasmid) [Mollicutes bacterium LVI A0078]|nr:hypothetical protein R2F61_09795 [Mollicutes bacterium LVI A0078]
MDRLEQLNLGLSEIDVDGVYFKDIDMFLKKNEYLRNSFEEVSAEEVYNDIFDRKFTRSR